GACPCLPSTAGATTTGVGTRHGIVLDLPPVPKKRSAETRKPRSREKRMSEFTVSRRQFVASSAIMSTLATLGIDPAAAWAEGNVLKIRMVGDIQVLDPGYMIGGAETTIQYATLPRLAVPVRDASGNFAWQPSEYVEKIEQTDDLHIAFTLKSGFKWSGDLGEITADDVKYSIERMLKSDWNSRWPTLDHVDVTNKYS